MFWFLQNLFFYMLYSQEHVLAIASDKCQFSTQVKCPSMLHSHSNVGTFSIGGHVLAALIRFQSPNNSIYKLCSTWLMLCIGTRGARLPLPRVLAIMHHIL